MLPKCDIVLISVNSPILLGIYINDTLDSSLKCEGKTSDILPQLFEGVMKRYQIKRIFYANGPGNFSALKLTHIFLHTLGIINHIELFCASSFHFTKDKFINAYGRIYFFKENDIIKTIRLDDTKSTESSKDSAKTPINATFSLPPHLHIDMFDKNCFPLYILPAV